MITIEPYVSAGSFRFGASYDEIVSKLGEPILRRKNRLGETVVRYELISATISLLGVVEVSFVPGVNVSIRGINAFGDANAFKELCEMDGRPKEVLGFIVLLNLGLTMTGFHDDDDSQKSITAFRMGRWDQLASELKDYAPF